MALYFTEIKRRVSIVGIVFGILVLIDIAGYIIIKLYIEGYVHRDITNLIIDAIFWTFVTLSTLGHYPPGVDLSSSAGKMFTVAAVISGAIMLFVAIPYAVAPWIEQKIKEASIPKTIELPKKGHIIVCNLGPLGYEVIKELKRNKIPCVAVDSNDENLELAVKLGIPFIKGEGTNEDVLKKAGIDGAKSIILTGSDEDNAFIALSAKSLRKDITVVASVEDMEHIRIMRKAGVDRAISPKYMVGTMLGRLAITEYDVDFSGRIALLGNMEIRQYTIGSKSRLCNKQLRNTSIREKTKVIVVGIWYNGEFTINPPSDTVIKDGAILLVLGKKEDLNRFEKIFID